MSTTSTPFPKYNPRLYLGGVTLQPIVDPDTGLTLTTKTLNILSLGDDIVHRPEGIHRKQVEASDAGDEGADIPEPPLQAVDELIDMHPNQDQFRCKLLKNLLKLSDDVYYDKGVPYSGGRRLPNYKVNPVPFAKYTYYSDSPLAWLAIARFTEREPYLSSTVAVMEQYDVFGVICSPTILQMLKDELTCVISNSKVSMYRRSVYAPETDTIVKELSIFFVGKVYTTRKYLFVEWAQDDLYIDLEAAVTSIVTDDLPVTLPPYVYDLTDNLTSLLRVEQLMVDDADADYLLRVIGSEKAISEKVNQKAETLPEPQRSQLKQYAKEMYPFPLKNQWFIEFKGQRRECCTQKVRISKWGIAYFNVTNALSIRAVASPTSI